MSSWACKFQMRYPKLYVSVLELRSFYRRIRLLYKRDSIIPLQTGLVWERYPDRSLRVNMRSQGRIRDIQNLLARQSWASPYDLRLFLSGWDAGCEWNNRNHDTRESRQCGLSSSAPIFAQTAASSNGEIESDAFRTAQPLPPVVDGVPQCHASRSDS
jgi:hypothetical protein